MCETSCQGGPVQSLLNFLRVSRSISPKIQKVLASTRGVSNYQISSSGSLTGQNLVGLSL
jgi:hypothetical protein